MKFLVILFLCCVADHVAALCADSCGQTEGKCGCCPQPCCCKCMSTDMPECSAKLCLGFLIDHSASIGNADLVFVHNFIIDLINKFPGSGTKTALVIFATNATIMWDFASPEATNPQLAEDTVVQIQLGKFTNGIEGMEKLMEVYLGPGVDTDCHKVSITMTDGRVAYRTRELASTAEQLKSIAHNLVVGVTDQIWTEQLIMQASDGEDGVYTVDQFRDLTDIVGDLVKAVCPEPLNRQEDCFCCCPSPWSPAAFGW